MEYQQEVLHVFVVSQLAHSHSGLTAARKGSEILSKADFPQVTSEEGPQHLVLKLQRRRMCSGDRVWDLFCGLFWF